MYDRPLVSVIVPSYNHENYIYECLESIHSNDYENIEIVFVDDGSEDDTYLVAKQWSEDSNSRHLPIHIEKQENLGLVGTISKLTSLARGSFIVLLASDDRLTNDSISSRLRKLNENPTWLVIFGNCFIIDESGDIKTKNAIGEFFGGNLNSLSSKGKMVSELILRWSVPGPATMARREAFEMGHDPSLIVEDRAWYLSLLAKNSVGFIAHPVAHYRIHTTNTISNPDKRHRLAMDLAKSEGQNIRNFSGIEKFFLICVYHRSLASAELYKNETVMGRFRLFLAKLIVWALYKIHSAIYYSGNNKKGK